MIVCVCVCLCKCVCVCVSVCVTLRIAANIRGALSKHCKISRKSALYSFYTVYLTTRGHLRNSSFPEAREVTEDDEDDEADEACCNIYIYMYIYEYIHVNIWIYTREHENIYAYICMHENPPPRDAYVYSHRFLRISYENTRTNTRTYARTWCVRVFS